MKKLLLVILLFLMAPAGAEITTEGAERDRFEIKEQTLWIFSGMGIGTVKLKPCPESGWEGLTHLRLLYANGKGMSYLEGLTLSAGEVEIRASGRLHQEGTRFTRDGKKVEVPTTFEEGALQLEIPTELLKGEELKIHWVDAYRR